MAKRITELTPAQQARLEPYADERIAAALDCTPADRTSVEDGIRRCYELAGVPWHGNVVWVDSPFTVAFAGPIASGILGSGAVDGAVHGAVRGAVHGAVRGAVDDAVRGAVDDAVDDAVDGAVHGAVRGAVDDAVRGAVDDAVHGAVRGAVDGAVDGAVRDLHSTWYLYIGGQWWAGWISWRNFFLDECDLDLSPDIAAKAKAYEDANHAGWWWPHRQFTIVSERPEFIHREQVGARGWGSHRLHCETGPAIRWRDGAELFFWHGTRVPAWVVMDPTVEKVFAEQNQEIRRCAIEALGWDALVDRMSLVDECDDPGNAPHRIGLYDLPDDLDLYDGTPVRVLLVTNGSPDRSGVLRRYGITVDGAEDSALAAAARSFRVPVDVYAALERRT